MNRRVRPDESDVFSQPSMTSSWCRPCSARDPGPRQLFLQGFGEFSLFTSPESKKRLFLLSAALVGLHR